MLTEKKWLTVYECADMVGVHYQTINNAIRREHLKFRKRPNGRVHVSHPELVRWSAWWYGRDDDDN